MTEGCEQRVLVWRDEPPKYYGRKFRSAKDDYEEAPMRPISFTVKNLGNMQGCLWIVAQLVRESGNTAHHYMITDGVCSNGVCLRKQSTCHTNTIILEKLRIKKVADREATQKISERRDYVRDFLTQSLFERSVLSSAHFSKQEISSKTGWKEYKNRVRFLIECFVTDEQGNLFFPPLTLLSHSITGGKQPVSDDLGNSQNFLSNTISIRPDVIAAQNCDNEHITARGSEEFSISGNSHPLPVERVDEQNVFDSATIVELHSVTNMDIDSETVVQNEDDEDVFEPQEMDQYLPTVLFFDLEQGDHSEPLQEDSETESENESADWDTDSENDSVTSSEGESAITSSINPEYDEIQQVLHSLALDGAPSDDAEMDLSEEIGLHDFLLGYEDDNNITLHESFWSHNLDIKEHQWICGAEIVDDSELLFGGPSLSFSVSDLHGAIVEIQEELPSNMVSIAGYENFDCNYSDISDTGSVILSGRMLRLENQELNTTETAISHESSTYKAFELPTIAQALNPLIRPVHEVIDLPKLNYGNLSYDDIKNPPTTLPDEIFSDEGGFERFGRELHGQT